MNTRQGYITQGSVRGRCPHVHRTLAGAASCLRSDMAGCARQGGYSDRIVQRYTNGFVELLGPGEHEELAALLHPDH